jgi:hypothetical protein
MAAKLNAKRNNNFNINFSFQNPLPESLPESLWGRLLQHFRAMLHHRRASMRPETKPKINR